MTTKHRSSQLDRSKLYGSKMTPQETVKHLSRTFRLRFKHRVSFDTPFTSATGSAKSKNALVFDDGQGGEVLFTESEARVLVDLGVHVPTKALRAPKKVPVKLGLGGLL